MTVGESTFRATREAIAYDELEPLTLKGKAEPVPAWEATGLLGERPAHRPSLRTGAPLIGRDEEQALLLSLAERVDREGRPHLVTVIGQAGVGKSRLLRELSTPDRGARPRAGAADRRVPAIRRRHLLLGAGRGDPGRVRDLRRRAGDAAWPKLLDGVGGLTGEHGEPSRPSATRR